MAGWSLQWLPLHIQLGGGEKKLKKNTQNELETLAD